MAHAKIASLNGQIYCQEKECRGRERSKIKNLQAHLEQFHNFPKREGTFEPKVSYFRHVNSNVFDVFSSQA